MNNQTSTQAPAQAGIEDLNGIFQEQLRGIVRDGPNGYTVWEKSMPMTKLQTSGYRNNMHPSNKRRLET